MDGQTDVRTHRRTRSQMMVATTGVEPCLLELNVFLTTILLAFATSVRLFVVVKCIVTVVVVGVVVVVQTVVVASVTHVDLFVFCLSPTYDHGEELT